MNYCFVIAVAVAISTTSSTTANVCQPNGHCECNDGRVSCTKYDIDGPLVLPDNATTVHFEDSFVGRVFGDGTLLAASGLQSVTWVASRITSVDVLHFDELTHLDLSGNVISRLADNAFDHCPRLEYIDLSGNRLNVLSDNMFANTKFLETVKIENNMFYSIPERLFRETVNIKTISIGNPNLSAIPANAMANLDKLEFLSIENSRIENISLSSFGTHTNLYSILLNNCTHLLTIDDDFLSSTPNIETIELNNCSTINALPPSIVSLKNLKRLYMFGTEVPPNCHNGWLSQWLNETTVVVGFTNYIHFTETINSLECPARIYHMSNSITLKLTKKGVVDCMAFGNPQPAITWLVPGGLTFHENKEADINIKDHPKAHNWQLNQIDNPLLLTNKNGSLHITRMLRTNVGNYTCYVSNKYGNDSKTTEVHLDSEVFFNIKINALILGITSALGFLMLTILCCAFKLLFIRLNCIKKGNQPPIEAELGTTDTKTCSDNV